VVKTDLAIVVGAGMAGSVAAARAAQLGRKVLLLDAAADASAGGNAAISGGGVHVLSADLRAGDDILRGRLVSHGWGHTRMDLVDAFVAAAPHAHRWMVSTGVRFQDRDASAREELIPVDTFLAPKRDMSNVHDWRDRGPQEALRSLQRALKDAGGELRESATVVDLIQHPTGRVTGVRLQDGRALPASSVLLADGGFQSNLHLRRRFIGPAADRMFLRAAASGLGTALEMGERVGAQISNPQWFYGHVLHRDVFTNESLWPWPALDGMLANGAILVDRRGQRLTDEGRGGIHIANNLGWSDEPDGGWVIANARVWESVLDSADPVPSNPGMAERGARIVRASSTASLAAETGIDSTGLAATLDAYNRAAESESTAALPLLRTGTAFPLNRDLIAFPAVAAITFTMGGLRIDADTRVLDVDGNQIPGLLAAGGSAAGPTAGYIGGLATALTFGYIAGARLAAGQTSRVPNMQLGEPRPPQGAGTPTGRE
jgi:fumarate reductase flavoprotein subunit